MKITDYIVRELKKNKVKVVFGYAGGNISDLIDSISLSKDICFIENYHEQASSFAANAFAQVTDSFGVAIASSGPGACNLINGVANAYFDSIPCVFITGNINTKTKKITKELRQNGFQETDIVSIVSDITKFAFFVSDPYMIRYYLEKAFFMAKNGRPGPVLLDIPYDVQKTDVNPFDLLKYNPEVDDCYDNIDIEQLEKQFKESKKPLLLVGGGARSVSCKKAILRMLDRIKMPVVASLNGLDVVPHNHECFIGFIGSYGNRYANIAIANCDLLIVLGSRLDERQIAGNKSKFAPMAKIIRVDIDKFELMQNNINCFNIYLSVEIFINKILKNKFITHNYDDWLELILKWKKRFPPYSADSNVIDANSFINYISEHLSDNAIICADVGQNQMSVAQSIILKNQCKLLNSGGFGSMGYSLPAAIGASYANKNSDIISINGDGGIQMNIQELQTIFRENLPIHIIIINNYCLGMIKHHQDRLLKGRNFASVEGFSSPDFSKIASAYEIRYLKVDSVDNYKLSKDFINVPYPTIIELCVPQVMRNYPEPGSSIDRQVSLLSDNEILIIEREVKQI